MDLKERLFLILTIITIIVSSSCMGMRIPYINTKVDSIFYIPFLTSIEFIAIYGLWYLYLNKGFSIPQYPKLIIKIGFFSTIMSVTMVYASNPTRTPAVIQSILVATCIIPSVVATKLILNKKVTYKFWYIIPSVLLLIISVSLSIIPITSSWSKMAIIWILIYFSGVVARSVYNVYQEKYMRESKQLDWKTKVEVAFYGRLVQFLFLLPCFGLEYWIGYDPKHPWDAFKEDFIESFTKGKYMGLLQLYMGAYIIMYIMSIHLNSISTNYNMILVVATNPVVGLFYTLFPQFNPGIQYPIWIVITTMIGISISVFLWFMGEKHEKKEDSVMVPLLDKESSP